MEDVALATINERVAIGILLREDSVYLLTKIAELEVKLAEARRARPSASGSVITQEQLP